MKTEDIRAGEFVVSEANGARSREAITVASGQNLTAGSVLGKVTANDEYAIHDPAATDGTEAAAAVLYAAIDATDSAQSGVAVVRDAEVSGELLTYITGISAGDKAAANADLAALGIIVR